MSRSGEQSIAMSATAVRLNPISHFILSVHTMFSSTRVGYEWNYFWIDALRDAGSADWYWETTKNILTENDFYWGNFQPSLPTVTDLSSCINFRFASGGYDDDYCNNVPFLDAMCQY
jgi:hypothetical protein